MRCPNCKNWMQEIEGSKLDPSTHFSTHRYWVCLSCGEERPIVSKPKKGRLQPNMLYYARQKKLRWISISLREVQRAVTRAQKAFAHDQSAWQAQMIEIALIPKLYKRWKELSEPPPVYGFTPAGYQEFERLESSIERVSNRFGPGYLVKVSGIRWNSLRDDYYAHHPNTAWDGIRRETICQWLEFLRDWALDPANFESLDERVMQSIFEAFHNAGVYPKFGGKTHMKGVVR